MKNNLLHIIVTASLFFGLLAFAVVSSPDRELIAEERQKAADAMMEIVREERIEKCEFYLLEAF
jgi:hypothetical protein